MTGQQTPPVYVNIFPFQQLTRLLSGRVRKQSSTTSLPVTTCNQTKSKCPWLTVWFKLMLLIPELFDESIPNKSAYIFWRIEIKLSKYECLCSVLNNFFQALRDLQFNILKTKLCFMFIFGYYSKHSLHFVPSDITSKYSDIIFRYKYQISDSDINIQI